MFVNKNCRKASTVSCFCLTKQKGSVELILLALRSNSTGSVLINDGTLGAGIKDLKPGALHQGNKHELQHLRPLFQSIIYLNWAQNNC